MTQKAARLNLYDFLNNEPDYAPNTSHSHNHTRSPNFKTYSTEEDDDEIGPWFDVLPPKLSVTPKAATNPTNKKPSIPLQTPKGDPKVSKLTSTRNYTSTGEKSLTHKSPKVIKQPVIENKPNQSGIFTNELLKERVSTTTRKVNVKNLVKSVEVQPKKERPILIVAHQVEEPVLPLGDKKSHVSSPKPGHSFKRSSIMLEKSLDIKGTVGTMRDSGEFEMTKSMTKIHSQTARIRGESNDKRHSRRPSPCEFLDTTEKPEANPSFVVEGIATKSSAVSKQQGFKLLKTNIIARNRNMNQKSPIPIHIPLDDKLMEKEPILSEGKRMIVTERNGRPGATKNLFKRDLFKKEKEAEKEDIKTKLRVLRRINRPSYQAAQSPNETRDLSENKNASMTISRQRSVPRMLNEPVKAESFIPRHSEADVFKPEGNAGGNYMLPLLKTQAPMKCPLPRPHLTVLNKNYDETSTNEVIRLSSYFSNDKQQQQDKRRGLNTSPILDSEKYILQTEGCETTLGTDPSEQIKTSPSPKNQGAVVFKFRRFTPTRMMDKTYKESLLGADFYLKSYNQPQKVGGEMNTTNTKQLQTPGKNPLYSLTQKLKVSKEQNVSGGESSAGNKNVRIIRKPTFEVQAAILQEKNIIQNARILKN